MEIWMPVSGTDGEQEPDGMLYYLATLPSLYGVIPLHLKTARLNRPHTRIIVEKPFGYDLESARELEPYLCFRIRGASIYRIDHFLGKETAEHSGFSFANGIFGAALGTVITLTM